MGDAQGAPRQQQHAPARPRRRAVINVCCAPPLPPPSPHRRPSPCKQAPAGCGRASERERQTESEGDRTRAAVGGGRVALRLAWAPQTDAGRCCWPPHCFFTRVLLLVENYFTACLPRGRCSVKPLVGCAASLGTRVLLWGLFGRSWREVGAYERVLIRSSPALRICQLPAGDRYHIFLRTKLRILLP